MISSIRFDRVTLWRRTQEELTYDLKRLIFRSLEGRHRPPSRRKTIDDLSFSIERGEKFGVIGANGSGKSTLLKLAAGILQPTTGSIEVRGRLAGLIELGAGFDGELTVIENIIYYGILLGFDRAAMRKRVPAILDFAELQDYGQMPLKALSSGMGARLGFAIATDVQPDIFLVDEVLSVGDEAFREKSAERMQALWKASTTIVMVSHDLASIVQSCERALWMDGGRIRTIGPARDVVHAYLQEVQAAARSRRLAAEFVSSTEPALGHIDRLVTHGRSLAVEGWALLANGGRGTRVAIFIDGVHFADAVYNVPRPDVQVNFPQADAACCGFTSSSDTAGLRAGDHRVDCAVLDEEHGRFHLIGESRTVTIAASPEEAAYGLG